MTHTTTQELFPLTEDQLKMLMTDLHPSRVSAKQGMSYVEAWDVKATLIRIFGFGGFSSELLSSEIVRADQVAQVKDANKTNWAITAKATVRLHIHQLGAVYTEAAIAGSKQPDFTEAADMALKSAESDALKRAAIFLGTQFGLSLYNNGATKEIVSTILAPGQEFRRGARVLPAGQPEQKQLEERPASAAGSVEHLRGEHVDDAAHERNKANLNSALSAQVKQREHRAGPDVPLYADESLEPVPAGEYDN